MAPHAEYINGQSNGPSTRGGDSLQKGQCFTVDSPNVVYTDDHITSKYIYHSTAVQSKSDGTFVAKPIEKQYIFQTERKAPEKLGLMIVGLGGNNGSTVAAGIYANKYGLQWETRNGLQSANWFGSVVMSSTIKLGTDSTSGEEVFIPLSEALPISNPNDFVIGGWDISKMNLAEAMDRAHVLQPTLKQLVRKPLSQIVPKKAPYYPTFIAANQGPRADNVLEGSKACPEHVEQIREDIR